MRGYCKGMLFGGAVFCAGLCAADAPGDVVGEQFVFRGTVDNVFEWDGTYNTYGSRNYVDTGVNDSFLVSGGLEVSPFNRSVEGGYIGNSFIGWHRASVGADVIETVGGGIDARLNVSARQVYGFHYDPPPFPSASATFQFTLTQAMVFDVEALWFGFDNDIGSAGVLLREVGGGVLFAPNTFDSDSLTASGLLGPGTYELTGSASGSGSWDVRLSIAVPAPPSAVGVAGVAFLARRRRR